MFFPFLFLVLCLFLFFKKKNSFFCFEERTQEIEFPKPRSVLLKVDGSGSWSLEERAPEIGSPNTETQKARNPRNPETTRCKVQEARWKVQGAGWKVEGGRCKLQTAKCELYVNVVRSKNMTMHMNIS